MRFEQLQIGQGSGWGIGPEMRTELTAWAAELCSFTAAEQTLFSSIFSTQM